MKKNKLILWIIHSLFATGAILGIMLAVHYYEIRNGTAGKSLCHFGDSMNCDAVAVSAWAEFAFGIPLASLGAGWFISLFFLSIVARTEALQACTVFILRILTLSGLTFGLFYVYIMFAKLHTTCIFCLGLDAIHVLTIILLWKLPRAKPPFALLRTTTLIMTGCVFFTVIALSGLSEATMSQAEVTEAANGILNSKTLLMKTEDLPSFGTPGAPITIVEFSDFQCPYCRLGAKILNSVMDRYPGKVHVIFRNFPLNAECNRMIERGGHPAACEAAKISLCAAAENQFQKVYDGLFEHQDKLEPTKITSLLGVQNLDHCVASTEVITRLNRDIEDATALGVKSTPTFFINGHLIEGDYPFAVWVKIIDTLMP